MEQQRADFVQWLSDSLDELGLDGAVYSQFLVSMLDNDGDIETYLKVLLAEHTVNAQVTQISRRRKNVAWQHANVGANPCACLTTTQTLETLLAQIWPRWLGEEASIGNESAPGMYGTLSLSISGST